MKQTIEQIKKNKNYIASAKCYPINPEGFTFKFLFNRLEEEYKELQDVRDDYYEGLIMKEGYYNALIDELADLSNIIDYIATKITVDYPDIHKNKEKEIE